MAASWDIRKAMEFKRGRKGGAKKSRRQGNVRVCVCIYVRARLRTYKYTRVFVRDGEAVGGGERDGWWWWMNPQKSWDRLLLELRHGGNCERYGGRGLIFYPMWLKFKHPERKIIPPLHRVNLFIFVSHLIIYSSFFRPRQNFSLFSVVDSILRFTGRETILFLSGGNRCEEK